MSFILEKKKLHGLLCTTPIFGGTLVRSTPRGLLLISHFYKIFEKMSVISFDSGGQKMVVPRDNLKQSQLLYRRSLNKPQKIFYSVEDMRNRVVISAHISPFATRLVF